MARRGDDAIDARAVRELATDLGRAPAEALGEVRRVVQRGALNIKRDMQAEATGSRRLAGIAPSITYTTELLPDGITAEIGPEIGRAQGSLGFVAYEGTPTSGPVFPDPQGALDRESEAVARHIADAVARMTLP